MPDSMCSRTATAVVLLLCISCCHADLVLVYSIQRHGARNVLPKSSLLSENEATGGPTLLPQGQRQCYEAGQAFRKRYLTPDSCSPTNTCLAANSSAIQYGVTGTPGVGFSNYNSYANTSALDRTIMSADSFLMGVFPPTTAATNTSFVPIGAQIVPVYSVADSEDWRIRGYTKCPKYQQRLEQWYSSLEFTSKEQETAAFRSSIQQRVPQLNTSLANWWNVFDAFNVWRSYQVGDAMPDIPPDDFNKTVELAMWLETRKMSPELTGNLIGGALLGDLVAKLKAAQQAVSAGSMTHYRLLTVSSHYNTQLGILSALQAAAQQQTDYLWRRKIPALAAVVAFELHADLAAAAAGSTGSISTATWSGFAVRAVYQDGPSAVYKAIPLPCAVSGDVAEALAGPASCTLEGFLALAEPQTLNTAGDWCDACENEKVLACAVSNMERQLIAVGVDPAQYKGVTSYTVSRDGSGAGVSPAMVAAWCVVSVAAAAAVAAAAGLAMRKYQQQQRSKQIAQQATAMISLPDSHSLV